jgi:hypothetical protein
VYCFAFDNRWLLPELAGQHFMPDVCFSILPSSGGVIIIERDKTGYTPVASCVEPHERREGVDNLNLGLGVTRGQEEAMLAGSLFGWDTPAAKPWKYDKDGNPRPVSLKKDTPER